MTAVTVLTLTVCHGCGNGSDSSRKPPSIVVANMEELAIPPPDTGPNARTPFAEPRATIDQKGPAGARAVVERYCALLKSGNFAAAHRLWLGDVSTDSEFARNLAGYGKLEGCAIDEPARLEGAAGSIYTKVPVEFFFNGGLIKLSAWLTLRRVNDVPGSTNEQRSWHIVKSELEPVD